MNNLNDRTAKIIQHNRVFDGLCDSSYAHNSPTGLTYPAVETGHLTVRTNATVREVMIDANTGKASGVAFIDSQTIKSYEVRAKVIVLAASMLESVRLLLLSKSRQHPQGIGNSSGHVGHNFCEHVMGPGITGLVKERIGKTRTIDDGRPGGFYLPRFRNLNERHPNFIRAYGFEGSSGLTMFPNTGQAGFGKAYKQKVRDYAGAYISMEFRKGNL
jgi:choline dehydrogenase-like flavoprotein